MTVNSPERLAYFKSRYHNNREEVLERVRSNKYKQPIEQRLLMLQEQGNACAICRTPITLRTSHVDHDHETGLVRGLLCNHCNLGLGHFRESQSRLQAAIDYLQSCEPHDD